ncbi:MAG TPA: hypothetical protein VL171_16650 [Verrucomicrobiae bacterium]|nr:hypothetical protein [Verrucomicrobiae bacterium]
MATTFKEAEFDQRFQFFGEVYRKIAPQIAEDSKHDVFPFLDETIIEPVEAEPRPHPAASSAA